MELNGYTKRWRKRWSKGLHQDLLLWVMMDYFIDFANFADTEVAWRHKGKVVGIIKLQRGQHLYTVLGLSRFLKASRGAVNRRLQLLSGEMQFLDIKTYTKYSVATILNYDKYQDPVEGDGHQNGLKADTNRTLTGHTVRKVKKDKEIFKEEETPLTPLLKFGDFQNVKMPQEDYDRLVERHGQAAMDYMIDVVDAWVEKGGKGTSSKDGNWRGFFSKGGWPYERWQEHQEKQGVKIGPNPGYETFGWKNVSAKGSSARRGGGNGSAGHSDAGPGKGDARAKGPIKRPDFLQGGQCEDFPGDVGTPDPGDQPKDGR